VLQDYINENRINESALSKLPVAIQNVLKLDKKDIKKLYKKSSYSILDQELKKIQAINKFRDFLELVKLGHYEIFETNIKKAIDHYNKINCINKINDLDDIENEQGQNAEKRFTERFMFIKDFKKYNKSTVIDDKYIYLFRHAETNWNVEKIIKGQLEDGHAAFTAKGLQEIKNLEMFLRENNIKRIFVSDLGRALDTAILANKELAIPMSFHKELRGFNMGKYQGLHSEYFLKEKDVIEAFKNYDKSIPGGESINQLNNRLMSFIEKIAVECPYKNIAIITHGAVISNLRASISGDSYIDIESCVLSYLNNTFKVIEFKKNDD
jgi:broad specificity phosphatase PhoE